MQGGRLRGLVVSALYTWKIKKKIQAIQGTWEVRHSLARLVECLSECLNKEKAEDLR